MILAAGLTPAWQQILVFDRFVPGEVNRARGAEWCGSGKVLNVGMALGRLGCRARIVSPLGGLCAESIRGEFAQAGVSARWIESAMPTRVCTTLLDQGAGTTTELVENSRRLPQAELDRFVEAYAEEAAAADIVVLSGSLPVGTPASFYRELMKSTPGRVILDARGEELLEALECGPFLVKPNREELTRTVGRDLDGENELIDAMRELNGRGAEWVVVSRGREPVLVTSTDETFRLTPPAVSIANPIGCGDCLAAGIACAVAEGKGMREAVRFGMGAAADNLRQTLPARISRNRVEALAERVQVA